MRMYILSLIATLLFPAAPNAQQNDLVKTQGITLPLHKTSIGKIAFTATPIPLSQLKENDFLHHYQLTNKSNLFITVFMGNSLTNYLHTLAPNLPADSLTHLGGYQFSAYIDHHLVYQSNIQGAPYPAIKDTETTITKPLINNDNEGSWWSQSFWYRFLGHGGDSALSEGTHLFKLEIRPYLQHNSLQVGPLIASGELSMQVYRKPVIDISKIQLHPVQPYIDLPVAHQHINTNLLKQLKGNIDEGLFKHISSLIVIKNGQLLVEEYFNGETRNTLHDPRSVGKSFASTITGIALRDGYLKNEQQQLKEFYNLNSYANNNTLKENITLKDLLTMSSPFDGNDDDGDSPGNEENMYPTDNWVKFTLDLPVKTTTPPGQWHYFTAGVILLGDILNQSVPGGLEKYADQKLFQPLHITNYQWAYTPQKVPNTAGGIRLTALDFAKYGLLYKNKGKWNNRQVIPEEWINKTFTKHKAIPGRNKEYYGYLFWNKTYTAHNKNYETFYCAGNGGNKIYIFKNQPLVIVITATAYGTAYAHTQEDKMMEQYILPAVL